MGGLPIYVNNEVEDTVVRMSVISMCIGLLVLNSLWWYMFHFFHAIRKSYRILIGILLFGIPIFLLAAWSSIYLLGSADSTDNTFWSFLRYGEFLQNGQGNAGKVIFSWASDPDNARLEGTHLKWKFTIQTIGDVFFSWVQIVPPPSGKVNDLWGVSGTAWSDNAWWVYLTWLLYSPTDKRLIGQGWNDAIGKVPFGSWQYIGDDDIGAGFVGRVKILGSSIGNPIYNTEDIYTLTYRNIASSKLTEYLNTIRENVAYITRNIPEQYINTSTALPIKTLQGKAIFKFDTTSPDSSRLIRYSDIKSKFESTNIQSIIILGGDIYIDMSIEYDLLQDTHPKTIIALKDSTTNKGGDVYVGKDVKRLYSSIITDWHIYSGEGPNLIYNTTLTKIPYLSVKQLYILGTVASYNTIGWSTQVETVCPYRSKDCTFEQAVMYDFNYFRSIDEKELESTQSWKIKGERTPDTRSYTNTSLDKYSVIIEYDTRVSTDPPPGMTR